MIFSGVFERYPNLKLAIVEFELARVPHLLSTWTTLIVNAMRKRYIDLRMAGVLLTFPSQCFPELPGG